MLQFGPVGCIYGPGDPFTFTQYWDLGSMRDMETRTGEARNYSGECRKVALVGVLLVNPDVVRIPERNDPRVSLETEMGLRKRFGIGPDDRAIVLLGKDGREHRRYSPPACLDEILEDVASLSDE